LFIVGENFYAGRVNIKITQKGRQLKDITQIEKATEGNYRSNDVTSPPASNGGLSNNNIPQNGAVVNTHSMQGGKDYSQNALLGKEYFTGDAMTQEARARWMGTPSVADGDTSLGEGGYGADAAMRGVGVTPSADGYTSSVTANAATPSPQGEGKGVPMSEAQVMERALQLTAEGKRKATAADFDRILQELGDDPPPLRTLGRFFRKFLLDCQKLYKYTAKMYIYHTYFPTLFARRL